MNVVATARGYCGQIREPGDVFDMPESTIKTVKDDKGKPLLVLPSWVKKAPDKKSEPELA